MVLVGGADEVVVGDVHQVKLLPDDGGHLVHKLLGGDAFGRGLQLVLLAVLVGAGLEEHIVALFALKAGNGVRQHNFVHVANVRLARGVGNGRGEIVLAFVCHELYPPAQWLGANL